ncbi:uncharacterized protein igl [Venturia canescens]|uniref:uncharacterized protein igl n=1 Tax=Venturia canescens TaxID=32260 RepID=UPI001C9CA7C0|nr:uncharacterized protein LOC122413288 [Venturia canescens]
MGCNTSKESVQPAAEDNKDDVKNTEAAERTVSGESTAEAGSPAEGSPRSPHSTAPLDGSHTTEDKSNEEEAAAAAAATRIQAVFRGHHARKNMKASETESATQRKQPVQAEEEPSQEQLREEFRADDKELCNAATKIQASFRGHMSRKEQAVGSVIKGIGEMAEDAAAKIEEKMDDALNELDGIDLTDPDLHKAATKIQASFRGHKVRQEVTEEKK